MIFGELISQVAVFPITHRHWRADVTWGEPIINVFLGTPRTYVPVSSAWLISGLSAAGWPRNVYNRNRSHTERDRRRPDQTMKEMLKADRWYEQFNCKIQTSHSESERNNYAIIHLPSSRSAIELPCICPARIQSMNERRLTWINRTKIGTCWLHFP